MSDALVVCAGCYRHVRSSERACPFCSAAIGAPPPASRPGALHTAVIAAALALAVSDRAYAQQNPPSNPRLDMHHGGAEGYGAPPAPGLPGIDPPGGMAPEPRAAAPMFELARQRVRPNSRRAQAREPWLVALRIEADGAWSAPGRSGRLLPAQLAELRTAAGRTPLSRDPTSFPIDPQPPRVAERLTLGARSVGWSEANIGMPGRYMRHIIELAYRLTRARPTAAPSPSRAR